jgi:Recombination endonuclease VII
MPALSKLYTKKEINKIREDIIKVDGDMCAICKKPRSAFKNKLSVDHNHKTGRIRGILCYYCNRRLVGRLTIESATKILNYLLSYDLPDKSNNSRFF